MLPGRLPPNWCDWPPPHPFHIETDSTKNHSVKCKSSSTITVEWCPFALRRNLQVINMTRKVLHGSLRAYPSYSTAPPPFAQSPASVAFFCSCSVFASSGCRLPTSAPLWPASFSSQLFYRTFSLSEPPIIQCQSIFFSCIVLSLFWLLKCLHNYWAFIS